jgi:hypothetical protein
VRIRNTNGAEPTIVDWRAPVELLEQMSPLELQLAAGHDKPPNASLPADLARIESVAARLRFVVDGPQIICDRADRCGRFAKAIELRVMRVATSGTAQHGLGEQRFAPQGKQTASVEVPRMEAPDPHSNLWRSVLT